MDPRNNKNNSDVPLRSHVDQPSVPIVKPIALKPGHVFSAHQRNVQRVPSLARKQFRSTAKNAFMTFKEDVYDVAVGGKALTTGWWEWFGMGTVSAGIALVGGVISVLAAFGLIGGPLTAGISLGVSIIGIAITIGYSIVTNYMQRREYARANDFLDAQSLYFENNRKTFLDVLDFVVFQELDSHITYTIDDATAIAKACMDVVTYAILKGKITSYDQLHDANELRRILVTYANKAPNTKLDVNSDTIEMSTRDVLRNLKVPTAQFKRASNGNEFHRGATENYRQLSQAQLLETFLQEKSANESLDVSEREPLLRREQPRTTTNYGSSIYAAAAAPKPAPKARELASDVIHSKEPSISPSQPSAAFPALRRSLSSLFVSPGNASETSSTCSSRASSADVSYSDGEEAVWQTYTRSTTPRG